MRYLGVPGSRRVTPNAPTIGTATDVGSGLAFNNASVSVTFTPAASGPTAASYNVIANPGSKTVSGTTSPIVVTGLTSSQSYTFTVTATNAQGTSAASAASNSVTATTVPAAPTVGTPTVAAGQAYAAAKANVSVPFTDNGTGGKAVSTYTVTSSTGATAAGATSPITVSETVGTYATYTITSTNANGTSVASTASTPATLPFSVPTAPTIGTATAGVTSASVAFTPLNFVTNPSFEAGNTTGYASANTLSLNTTAANARTGSNSALITLANVTDTNIIYWVATTLPAVGTYTTAAWFYVPAGSGLAAATVSIGYEGTGAPTLVSSRPATLVAGAWARASVTYTFTTTAIGPMVARLSLVPNTQVGQLIYSDDWSVDQTTAGGVPVTSYTAKSSAGAKTGIGYTSPISVTGLTAGTATTFTVTATNSSGTSAASTASNSVTPTAPPPAFTPPPSFAPAQLVTITGASLTAVSASSWVVAVSGSNISSQPPTNIGVGAANATGVSYSASSASGTITGLTAGATYNVQFFNGALPLTASYNVTAPTYVAPPSFPPAFTPTFPPSFPPAFTPTFPPSFVPPTFPPSFIPPPSFPPAFTPPSFGGGGCFAYGSTVLMADGSSKNIEDLQIGDEVLTSVVPTYPNGEDYTKWWPSTVWSTSDISGIEKSTTKVTGTRHIISTDHYLLNNTSKVTYEHWLFIKRAGTWQFETVWNLVVGDVLLNSDNEEVPLNSIEHVMEGVWVVDVDVEPNDLFYADGYLVHNQKAI